MERYLSIGEMAKARGVNVQSLRYYEKLGILVPEYVNPQSGYRYYAPEQIMILDTIILCVDLGIPLKRLKDYVDDAGQLEFERLLEDGRQQAQEKMRKIETSLHTIDRTLQHVHAQKDYLGRQGHYSRFIFARAVLTLPCPQTPSGEVYEKTLNSLFDLAYEKGLKASFPHGIISHYEDGHFCEARMFLEVQPEESEWVECLPAGKYHCYQEKREIHTNPALVFAENLKQLGDAEIIVSSMSPSSYKYDEVVLEFQLLQTMQASAQEK